MSAVKILPNAAQDASNQSSSSATPHTLSATAIAGYWKFSESDPWLADGDASEFRAYDDASGAWEWWLGAFGSSLTTISRRIFLGSSTGTWIDWSSVGVAPRIVAVALDLIPDREILRLSQVGGAQSYYTFDNATYAGLFVEGYDYRFQFNATRREGNYGALYAQLYNDGGAAWLTTAADYYGRKNEMITSYFSSTGALSGLAYIPVTTAYEGSGAWATALNDPNGVHGELNLHNPMAATRTRFDTLNHGINSNAVTSEDFRVTHVVGHTFAAGANSGVRFYMNAGSIEGTIICRRTRILLP